MSESNSTLTTARLRELLHFEPDTGVFTWRDTPLVHKWRGKQAGRLDNGYIRIRIDRQDYLGHRLAWFYVHGEWPDPYIDHINGEKSDNRMVNLREATHGLNMQNRRSGNIGSRSGLLGVKWDEPSQRWEANITVDGRVIYLGKSKEKNIASAMYIAAKRAVHRACTLDPVDM
jgi:hypothetical protein